MIDQFLWYIVSIPLIIISLTFHEWAHAWVAFKLGDPTAKIEGRMTLNPLKHIDPIGFLFMIIFKIGWAKPVPVDIYNFDNPLRGQLFVALAGPVSNLILFAITTLLLLLLNVTGIITFIPSVILSIIVIFLYINISLALFNLLPIPPLDGGNIIGALLPEQYQEQWAQIRNYTPILFLILFFPGSPFFAIFSSFWYNVVESFISFALKVAGL